MYISWEERRGGLELEGTQVLFLAEKYNCLDSDITVNSSYRIFQKSSILLHLPRTSRFGFTSISVSFARVFSIDAHVVSGGIIAVTITPSSAVLFLSFIVCFSVSVHFVVFAMFVVDIVSALGFEVEIVEARGSIFVAYVDPDSDGAV